ncbi:DUF1972 domain-containing protein [Noviherbaspirillum cavernae]|uniref:DUF1972 domain-containing protein n=1 Tax=Noviherbaspirillum cavernae TaxID=2320862 RepID=A0A418X050_9BURK|nr:DUF1972 domain-containing protein [Noviherbaspirillum cavernae]RJG05836.1 DUF1972 domain-containing protein [Noviherbaspirillum cavernae]
MKIKAAFIGAVGVPNNYGGFEMFLDSCSPTFVRIFDEVMVTCDRTRYENRDRYWQGVRRIFIPVRANGVLSILHDLLAFLAVFWRSNVVIVLGVSGGVFFPLFRLLCSVTGKKLIVNVDGIEWRREKYSVAKRTFLFISDRLAQIFAHRVVIDNEALRQFLTRSAQGKTCHIAYPGDHVIRTADSPDSSIGGTPRCLTICRIEPENNCHLLIEAFAKARQGNYIFVGNWEASRYGRELRSLYRDCPGLEMRDPTYNKAELASLRESCDLYLHGHSVGGTNPSLVEMLFYDCRILAFDCAFNRCTGADALDYFRDESELVAHLHSIEEYACVNRAEIRSRYTVEGISSAYAKMISGMFLSKDVDIRSQSLPRSRESDQSAQ